MTDKTKFQGNEIDVEWDGRLCIHIGEYKECNEYHYSEPFSKTVSERGTPFHLMPVSINSFVYPVS